MTNTLANLHICNRTLPPHLYLISLCTSISIYTKKKTAKLVIPVKKKCLYNKTLVLINITE